MSTVPPGPRLRFRGEAVSSSRCRISRISAANSGCQGGPNAASATACIACSAGRRRAEHDAGLAERLPFPELAAPFGEVAGEGGERHGQRAALAGRPQPGVDFVQPAVRAEVARHADHALAELAEEVAVGGAAVRAALPAERVAAGLVQEDQIEIAVIVRLAAAELAEREHDQLAGVALAVGEALPLLQRHRRSAAPIRWE